MKKITIIIFFLSGIFLLSAGIALAQTQQKKSSSADTSSTPGRTTFDLAKSRKKARVLLDKIDVIGSLAKPQAIFIIPGSDPKVDGIAVDRSFFVEIFRPVEKDFFPQKGRRKFRGVIPW
jgi:hypothetical protein